MAITLQRRRRRAYRAPALTPLQIARLLTPTIIIRRPRRVDEHRQRRDDPTIYDLADLTPLQRWQRGHTERLRTPQPGSGLVVSGEVSIPWRQYVRAAAHNRLPAAMRHVQRMPYYEHTIAPCESHDLVVLGSEAVTWREIKRRFLRHEYKYFTQALHLHRIDVRLDEHGRYVWQCRECGQHGLEAIDEGLISRADSVTWYGCMKCYGRLRGGIGRREFLARGLTLAGLSYAAWVSHFDGLVPILNAPPAWGVPQTYYVAKTGLDTNPGTSAQPFLTIGKGRLTQTTNNGDSLLIRTGTYAERFSAAQQFKPGNAENTRTIVAADTGNVPTISTTGGNLIQPDGAAAKYITFRSLKLNCQSSANGAIIITNSASFIRVLQCEGSHSTVFSGIFSSNAAPNTEFIESIGHDFSGGTTTHAFYPSSSDSLVQECDGYAGSGPSGGTGGYAVHVYSSGAPSLDRTLVRDCVAHTGNARGFIIQRDGSGNEANDNLLYNNVLYDCDASGSTVGAIWLRRVVKNCGIYNNTIVNNAIGGISIGFPGDTGTIPSGTRLRNNICKGNGAFGNFRNLGTATDADTMNTTASFVDETARNFHLIVGSSAINAGSDQSSAFNAGPYPQSPALDKDGQGRTAIGGSAWDFGAFEFVSNPPEPPGPPWHRGRLR